MSTNDRCPACDVEGAGLNPTEAFAAGFAMAETGLRKGYLALGEGPHKTLCNTHRTAWAHAERNASDKLDQYRLSRGGS